MFLKRLCFNMWASGLCQKLFPRHPGSWQHHQVSASHLNEICSQSRCDSSLVNLLSLLSCFSLDRRGRGWQQRRIWLLKTNPRGRWMPLVWKISLDRGEWEAMRCPLSASAPPDSSATIKTRFRLIRPEARHRSSQRARRTAPFSHYVRGSVTGSRGKAIPLPSVLEVNSFSRV